jgi:hypothetical protein
MYKKCSVYKNQASISVVFLNECSKGVRGRERNLRNEHRMHSPYTSQSSSLNHPLSEPKGTFPTKITLCGRGLGGLYKGKKGS